MERLTEKELYDGKVQYTKCSKTNCKDRCCDCPVEQEIPFRLKAYEDAEEQGLLLRLPCKVGDTVYIIQSNGQIKANEADMMFLGVMWDEYGKEWFTTKEEAESALAEKGGAE